MNGIVGSSGSTAINTKLTKRNFWNRFPSTKERTMRAVMASGSPALLAGSLMQLDKRVSESPFVDVTLAQTIEGVNGLAHVSVPETLTIDGQTVPLRLTAEEVAAILALPTAEEAYTGA